jgi:hypothetical protein
MQKSHKIADSQGAKCRKPTILDSVQLVGTTPINVFYCGSCDKLSAVAAARMPSDGVIALQP